MMKKKKSNQSRKNSFKLSFGTITAIIAIFFVFGVVYAATALVLSAHPWEYDPGKTHTIYAKWVSRLGLPDNNGDKNYALVLSKDTATSTNAAPGATIKGVKNIQLTEIGFDLRDGGHCGAGAPRFNIVTNDNVTHFAGCTYATTDATVPATGWMRKRFSATDLQTAGKVFPPLQPGSTVKSIDIVMDEGTDTAPDNSGLSILDNIDINGVLIGQPGDTPEGMGIESLDIQN